VLLHWSFVEFPENEITERENPVFPASGRVHDDEVVENCSERDERKLFLGEGCSGGCSFRGLHGKQFDGMPGKHSVNREEFLEPLDFSNCLSLNQCTYPGNPTPTPQKVVHEPSKKFHSTHGRPNSDRPLAISPLLQEHTEEAGR
jgi:hypothetical protein